MNSRTLLPLAGILVVGLALAAEPGRIDQLIAQLGSDQFRLREDASKELEAIGLPALEALKKAAAQSGDAETRKRAEELIARLEKRQETARILAGTKVSFDYREKPLAEAVLDLANQTGRPIALHPETSSPSPFGGGGIPPWVTRKVTVKAEKLDFWLAFEHFCRAAKVVEATRVSVPLGNAQVPVPVNRQAGLSDQIVLMDGAGMEEAPTSYHGAARVRALPADAGFVKDQTGCALGLALESGLQVSRILGVRVEHAIGDQGQELEYVPGDPAVGNPAFIGNVRGQALGLVSTSGQHQAPVRFKGDAKTLKKLSGTIATEVRTRPETLMTVDNILKAAGQTAKGKGGGAMTVQEVSKMDDGSVQVRVELQAPPDNNPANAGAIQIQIQQVQIIQIGVGGRIQPITNNEPGLALLDAKGQRFDLAGIPSRRTRIDQNGISHEYLLVFRPRDGLGEAEKLTYSSTRLAIVEIPFTLENVPLR